MSEVFNGANLALFHRGQIITLLRDDIAGIPWPNRWDLPGGGREGRESPIGCALRELREELNIRLPAAAIHRQRRFASDQPGRAPSVFLAAEMPEELLSYIRLGDEGQGWQWMSPARYLSHARAIPTLQARLAVYLWGRHSAE